MRASILRTRKLTVFAHWSTSQSELEWSQSAPRPLESCHMHSATAAEYTLECLTRRRVPKLIVCFLGDPLSAQNLFNSAVIAHMAAKRAPPSGMQFGAPRPAAQESCAQVMACIR
eukprot:1190516-Prorocentrum_minimum.AAC.4